MYLREMTRNVFKGVRVGAGMQHDFGERTRNHLSIQAEKGGKRNDDTHTQKCSVAAKDHAFNKTPSAVLKFSQRSIK